MIFLGIGTLLWICGVCGALYAGRPRELSTSSPLVVSPGGEAARPDAGASTTASGRVSHVTT